MTSDKLQPALLGGAFLGVLSALPILNIGNYCCCLWVIAGGFLAAYLLQQNQAAPVTPGDGALVGFLAGVSGAVVFTIVSVPVNLVTGPLERQMLERFLEQQPDVAAHQLRDALQQLEAGPGWILIRFIFMLVIGMIFATIGGVIGAVIVSRKLPPTAPPDVPPYGPPPGPPPPPPAPRYDDLSVPPRT